MEQWLIGILNSSPLPLSGLLIILIGGYRGWWVYGTYHRERIAQYEAAIVKAEKRIAALEERIERSLITTHGAVTVAAATTQQSAGG